MNRAYQYRPSADRLGNAPWVYGRLQPMEQPRRSIWQLLLARREGRK